MCCISLPECKMGHAHNMQCMVTHVMHDPFMLPCKYVGMQWEHRYDTLLFVNPCGLADAMQRFHACACLWVRLQPCMVPCNYVGMQWQHRHGKLMLGNQVALQMPCKDGIHVHACGCGFNHAWYHVSMLARNEGIGMAS